MIFLPYAAGDINDLSRKKNTDDLFEAVEIFSEMSEHASVASGRGIQQSPNTFKLSALSTGQVNESNRPLS